jgi:hypothetical protein
MNESGQWFSPGTSASSINKIDCHDITDILIVESGIKHHKPNQTNHNKWL